MKRSVVAVGLVMLMIPVVGMCEDSVLKTSGGGYVEVRPNVVAIRFHIGAKGETAKTAASETAAKYESVAKSLTKLGYERDEIVTLSFVVSEYQDRDPVTRKLIEEGYEAKHNIEIKSNEFEMIGRIVDRAIEGGATKVTRINFSSTKMAQLQDDALEKAVNRAKRKATIMATTAGGRLGRLIEMNTTRPMTSTKFEDFSSMPTAATSIPTTIVPPMLHVSAVVEVKYEYVSEKGH